MKKYKWLIALYILIMCNTVNAQLPFGDSAWILQTNLSDEFDTAGLRTNKWNNAYWGGTSPTIANGAEINYAGNLSFNSATLKIKADTLAPNVPRAWGTFPDYKYGTSGQSLTYAYQGGVVQSKTAGYKYGYIEYSAKFPSKKYPLWPALWLLGGPTNTYNELDIAENGAFQSFAGNHIGTNYHTSNITGIWDSLWHGGWDNIVLPAGDSLSGTFHKFALQWDSLHVTWFFDDAKVAALYDPTGAKIPCNNVGMLINFCIDPAYAYLPNDWNGQAFGFDTLNHRNKTPTQWPQFLEVEYVRYYKLGAECTTDLSNLCTPSDYNRKVKRSITTDATCSPNFSPSTAAGSYTLRATDYILINEGTTINPTGTGYFSIEPTPCPQ